MSQRSLHTRYLVVQEICLLFINFHELKKISTYHRKVFISLIKQKHSFDGPYNFVKIAKIRETCDDFSDVERYATVI